MSPVSEIIGKQVFRTLASNTLLQLVVVLLVMSFLSYNDARRRAAFLADSNENSLGLMISTGDYFQLQNVLPSFRNKSTPVTRLVNVAGEDILFDSLITSTGLPKDFPAIRWKDDGILLFTIHPIRYNQNIVGKLILANRIQVSDWLIICVVLLLVSVVTFFIHAKRFQYFAMQLGQNIVNLGMLFRAHDNEAQLNRHFFDRDKSEILEIEGLAENIKNALIEQIRAADLKREAAIGRIIGNLSHDLRAPLTSFEKLLSLPHGTPIESEKRSISESLRRLYAMIDSLRFADLELLIKRQHADIYLATIIETVHPSANRRGISILLSNQVDPIAVYIDFLKFERAVLNLIANAIDFAQGKVRIESEIIGRDLLIRVIDDGPGVPQEFLPKLFQRGATHGKADGTGLGLAYVRQIVRGHGGDVTYSRENGLTIFECRLPNAVVEQEQQAVEIEANLEMKLEQKAVKKVAICLDPPALTQTVITQLASQNSEKFHFSEERDGALIVVSNVDDIMFEVLARDDQQFIQISDSWGTETQMIGLLKHKLNLV